MMSFLVSWVYEIVFFLNLTIWLNHESICSMGSNESDMITLGSCNVWLLPGVFWKKLVLELFSIPQKVPRHQNNCFQLKIDRHGQRLELFSTPGTKKASKFSS